MVRKCTGPEYFCECPIKSPSNPEDPYSSAGPNSLFFWSHETRAPLARFNIGEKISRPIQGDPTADVPLLSARGRPLFK